MAEGGCAPNTRELTPLSRRTFLSFNTRSDSRNSAWSFASQMKPNEILWLSEAHESWVTHHDAAWLLASCAEIQWECLVKPMQEGWTPVDILGAGEVCLSNSVKPRALERIFNSRISSCGCPVHLTVPLLRAGKPHTCKTLTGFFSVVEPIGKENISWTQTSIDNLI